MTVTNEHADLEEALERVEDLQTQNSEYRRQLFIAESVIQEMRQALADSQFKQAQLNGQIKYLTQPTA